MDGTTMFFGYLAFLFDFAEIMPNGHGDIHQKGGLVQLENISFHLITYSSI